MNIQVQHLRLLLEKLEEEKDDYELKVDTKDGPSVNVTQLVVNDNKKMVEFQI